MTDDILPHITYRNGKARCECGRTETMPHDGPDLGRELMRFVAEHRGHLPVCEGHLESDCPECGAWRFPGPYGPVVVKRPARVPRRHPQRKPNDTVAAKVAAMLSESH